MDYLNIKERDKQLHMFNRTKDQSHYQLYCKLRNKVHRLIKLTQQNYIENQIDPNKNNSKKLRKTLQSLGYNNKAKTKQPIVLNINDKICYDPVTISEYVNDFFVNIANKLVEKLPNLADLYSAFSYNCKHFYLKLNITPNMYTLQEVDQSFTLNELKEIDGTKSTGHDNIGPRFLCDGAEGLAPIITHLINLSIRTKIVPDCTKKAKVTPLFKKKSKLDVGNYRPVSVLTSISKLLEKAIYKQVETFCKEKKVIYPLQSGFRRCFSTSTCHIYLQDYIRKEISSGKFVGMVMLDVQKAFDSVDHDMLCEKIRLAGIDPEWFRSYLNSRKQLVSINNNLSSELTIKCGVPQGSILGPWCYLLYSNDISSCVSCNLIMYADDTILLFSDPDIEKVASELSKEIGNCLHWLTNNRLSMHMGKTETLVFSSKRKKNRTKNFVIQCQGHDIKPSKVKYLGLTLNQTLSGEDTVTSILSKCTSRLKFMYRHSKTLNEKSRKLLASALIQCHFDYASSAWYSGTTKELKIKLQIAQNKMVRFILNLGPRSHIGQAELDKAGFLNTSDRVSQLMLNHMFNIHNGTAPSYLSDNFTRVSDQHHHFIRNAEHNFIVPRVQGVENKNFYYQGVKIWNELPTSVKSLSNKYSFKHKVKQYLRNRATNVENCDFLYY